MEKGENGKEVRIGFRPNCETDYHLEKIQKRLCTDIELSYALHNADSAREGISINTQSVPLIFRLFGTQNEKRPNGAGFLFGFLRCRSSG